MVAGVTEQQLGNLVYRKTSRNFSPMMATAGRVTIAEVEHLVEPGELDPAVGPENPQSLCSSRSQALDAARRGSILVLDLSRQCSIRPCCSIALSRAEIVFGAAPASESWKSWKRWGPFFSRSRRIRIVQRSPIRSSVRATGQFCW